MSKFKRTLLLAIGFALVPSAPLFAAEDSLLQRARATFKALPEQIPAPASNPTTPAKVELGRQLFFDPRLSVSGAISCNSCHNLGSYGTDNLITSLGHRAQPGKRNAPSVFNAGLQFRQFWDGRANELEGQAKGPILNPKEMAMPNPELTLRRVRSIPGYAAAFKEVFGGPGDAIEYDHIAEAIAAFERTLTTPHSPFDEFLQGNASALSAQQKHGLQLFMGQGCASCHNGQGVGGESFQRFAYPPSYGPTRDLGRFDETKHPADRGLFKVASLRNVARTYPYFHDGRIWRLDEAVKIMAASELHHTLSSQEVADITAFLESLTGTIPPQALRLPVLPPSGPLTPRPTR